MQSSTVVAGMDALSYPCENILTRRANQWHCSIIAQFARRPWPCPTTGSSSAIAGKKSLPTIEVASARRSCTGSPKLHRLATAKGRLSRCRAARAFRCASPRRYRREHSSRPRQGDGTSTWNHKSVLQPILPPPAPRPRRRASTPPRRRCPAQARIRQHQHTGPSMDRSGPIRCLKLDTYSPCVLTQAGLEHDPEKHALGPRPDGWILVFPRDKREAFARRSCSNKKIEQDDDSRKSHPALTKKQTAKTKPAPEGAGDELCGGRTL